TQFEHYHGFILNADMYQGGYDDASTFRNEDFSPLTYTWTTIDKPEGANDPVITPMNDRTDNRYMFAAVSKAGYYRFRLTFADSEGKTSVQDVEAVMSRW